jgi:hypothetical protein
MTKDYDVFISAKELGRDGKTTRDSRLAVDILEYLSARNLSVFLSNSELEALGASAFKKTIDEALDKSQVLVAVGTTTENLEAEWVRYEWDSFFNDIISGVKPDGRVFTYIEGLEPKSLPRALRQTQAILHREGSLELLYRFIVNALDIDAAASKFKEKERAELQATPEVEPVVVPTPELASRAAESLEEADGTSAQVFQEYESMKKIRKIMAEFIPKFEQLFPDDLESRIVKQLRESKVFRIHTKRALVVGRTGAGKTTTINRLFEQEILPTAGQLTCTSCLACGEHRDGLILYDSPGIGDDEAAEDVARIACGLPQIGSPLERLKLIDLTPARSEGPARSNVHSIEEFQDQINLDYYRNNAGSISFKSFSVDDFRQWASFDFLIFVLNTTSGLPISDLRFLANTIKVASERGIQIFKVINVFDGTFKGSIAMLTPEANAKVQQAKQRLDQKLTEQGITHSGPWLLLNSRSGEGVDRLISALADALPDDALRTLERTLRTDYQHLIRGRLEARFFDYVARVAALVGVFPADYETQGIDLLEFAIQSILVTAEYLLGRGKVSFATDVIDEMVSDLQDDREKTAYRTVAREVIVPTGSVWVDGWRDLWGEHEKKIVYERVPDDTYYDIGGKKAIRLALAIGLTLRELFRDAENEARIHGKTLRKRIAGNMEIVRDRLKRCNLDAIKEILEDARDLEGKKKKKRAREAENLWKELRPVLNEG